MKSNPLLMTVMGANPGRRTQSNPPAYFIIDQSSNRIMKIVRGHPMKSFPKSVEEGQRVARQLGRPVIHVVHPYVPTGFKVGSVVTPLFYSYGSNVIYPEGGMGPRTNPLVPLPESPILPIGPAAALPFTNPHLEGQRCRMCGGSLSYMGTLGYAEWYRCRSCGWELSTPVPRDERRRVRIARNPSGGMLVVATPALLEAQKIIGWMGRELGAGNVWLGRAGNEWGVYVPRQMSSLGRAAFERVISKNPRRARSEDALDKEIEKAYYRHGQGVQVSVLDIPKIFRDAKLEMAAGVDLDTAMKSIIERYRVNPSRARHVRERVSTKIKFDPRGFRTVVTKSGHKIVVGCPRGKWDPRRKRCKVGTRAQSVLHPMKNGLRPAHIKTYCQLCGAWAKSARPFHRASVGKEAGKILCDLCWRGMRSWRRSGYKQSENPKYTIGRGRTERTLTPAQARRIMENPRRKRVTLSIAEFARRIRSQRDPALWKSFQEKLREYRKWTHGSLPSKVTIEAVDVPGVKGVWMTTDLGKTPETTYLMPKNSKRKGAWKHPWTSMPSMKGDGKAGIILTRLRSGNRLTDFLHG